MSKEIIRRILPSGDVIHELIDKTDETIERLRKMALQYNPKHGDKLYPLEVLGAYHVVHNMPTSWDFNLGSNPEVFIDNQIAKWVSESDPHKFRNRLERCLMQDEIVRTIFLLRLNYALLLEEGSEEIRIYRGRKTDLQGYGAIDDSGKVYGDDGSSVELLKDSYKLDKIAESFYAGFETLSSRKTGTKAFIREKIISRLAQLNYPLEGELNIVYNQLNELNKRYLEEGLIARIAYVAFESEDDGLRISLG